MGKKYYRPRSSCPFYVVSYKMGHYFLDIQYVQKWLLTYYIKWVTSSWRDGTVSIMIHIVREE